MINEIWGHEFWSADGTTSWYQLYTPRAAGEVAGNGSDCWIAGTNLQTHKQTWYHLDSAQASIHVNISRDGSHFAGDGGTPNPWIMLHTPHLTRNMAQGIYDATDLIQPGTIDTERLVNMSNHQYALEPNVMFTPDMKWIVFRSNMFGPSYVFEVEIAKAQG
jgi:oligogalacturonide lyase